MKKFPFLFMMMALFMFSACGDDDETVDPTPETSYEIMIMQPTTDDKMVGDDVHLHINFDEANDGTIHHVNVRIYNKDSGDEIYNGPSDAHVLEASGHHEHHDDIVLNVDPDTDWILEAKIWGHEAGAAEKTQTVEFHVDPQ